MTIEIITEQLELFAEKRDWKQFHSPKNLAMALSVEASELAEIFQWLTEDQSNALNTSQMACVEDEVADVMAYLLYLCNSLNIDPLAATAAKIERNKARFPSND